MLQRHGWRLVAHPLLLNQLETLIAAAERSRRAGRAGWQDHAHVTLPAILRDLLLDRVPRDPLSAEFRQGGSLGRAHRHWCHAKFGGDRFRLFFRVSAVWRVVVYAWINDRNALRGDGVRNDPYAVFARMLADGTLPDDWPGLLAAAAAPAAVRGFAAAVPGG